MVASPLTQTDAHSPVPITLLSSLRTAPRVPVFDMIQLEYPGLISRRSE